MYGIHRQTPYAVEPQINKITHCLKPNLSVFLKINSDHWFGSLGRIISGLNSGVVLRPLYKNIIFCFKRKETELIMFQLYKILGNYVTKTEVL